MGQRAWYQTSYLQSYTYCLIRPVKGEKCDEKCIIGCTAGVVHGRVPPYSEHERYLRAHCDHSVVSWFAEAELRWTEWSAVRGCGLGFSEVMVILPWESG